MEEIKKEGFKENLRVVHIVDESEETNDGQTLSLPRFTRTGKISHAKTRVYTQRYRKEWESMTDFKDWLTSVPGENTRAFCKFCERNLHAHRLSLLKHMCTLKHQRAAAQFQRQQVGIFLKNSATDFEETMEDENDNDNVEEGFEECSYVMDEEVIEESEEIVEQSESHEDGQDIKKSLIDEERKDVLVQVLSQVNSNYIQDNDGDISLQLESSDHEIDELEQSNEVKSNLTHLMNDDDDDDDDSNNAQEEETDKSDFDTKVITTSRAGVKSINTNFDKNKKVIILTSNGKPVTIVKGSKMMLNSSNKNYSLAKLLSGDSRAKFSSSPSNPVTISRVSLSNSTNSLSGSQILMKQKKPVVSTYVLETSKGTPVCGLQVSLYKLQEGRWTFVEEGVTNVDGICNGFTEKRNLLSGRYKLHYDVEKYYNLRKIATIYPFIEIVFDIKNPQSSHHTPLYLSPYSYSTFKDMSK